MKTTKIRGNFKVMVKAALCLLSFLAIALFALNPAPNALAYEGENPEQVIRIPSIDENFKDDRVIVVLNQRDSRVNREVRIEDFRINSECANFGQITDLFRVDDPEKVSLLSDGEFFQILQIDLIVRGKEQVIQAIRELQNSEIVYSAEPSYNYAVLSNWTPDDTDFATNQWGLTGANGIQAQAAWDFTRGNANLRVGVMEAGFDAGHNDLAGNVLALPGGFTPEAGTDLDHGTHVAGIIGAVSNNNRGIAGIAQVSLVQLSWDNITTSLNFATNNNIMIINGSFGIYELDALDRPIAHLEYGAT